MVISMSSIFAQNEPPAISASNRNSFFIADPVLKKYKLETGQTDDWMKVYNNFGDDATIQRVNDIRWQATDKNAASQWYLGNKELLSENGTDITTSISKPVGVDEWNVYGTNENMKKMMEAMGVKQNQYCFTFTVDQYVAKIFVATTEKQTVQDAWKLAKEGVRATLTGAGKKKIADLML